MKPKRLQDICNVLTLAIWLLNIFIFLCYWLPAFYGWNEARVRHQEALERYRVVVGEMEARGQ